MKNPNDPRHMARSILLQELFMQAFRESQKIVSIDFDKDEYLVINEAENYDTDLYQKIQEGINNNTDKLNKIISEYAPQWPIQQIKLVDLQILKIAIFEGFIGKITPPKVAIDEAIELAKEFGGQSSDKFVNGVLGTLFEKHKPTGVNKQNE